MLGKYLRVFLSVLALCALVSCVGGSGETGATETTGGKAPRMIASSSTDPQVPQVPGKDVFVCTSAGQWFPADPQQLRAAVGGFLAKAKNRDIKGRIVGLISPHAGYPYSGPVAAYSYKQIEGRHYDTVVVVGFLHRTYSKDINIFAGDAYKTPLGEIEIDKEIADALIAYSDRIVHNPAVFAGEHSLDTQLPFLQYTLDSFKLVPVLVGMQNRQNLETIALALASVLKGKNVLMVASTDMSHFWPYDEANRLDAEMIDRIKAYDIMGMERLMEGDATGRRMCGHGVVRAVMSAARELGADEAVILKHANSQDTYGPTGNGVVGYLAAALVDTDTAQKSAAAAVKKQKELPMEENKVAGELTKEEQKELLAIARNSLETFIRTGKRIDVTTKTPALQEKKGMFVTLEKNNILRGCMGHFEPDTPIGKLAASQIIVSATHDPRFPTVSENELSQIDIEISVLSVPEYVDSYEDIEVGKHGVILQKNGRAATFLPQVAPEQGWDRDTMLDHLSWKAGLSTGAWKQGARFQVYTAQVFGETDFTPDFSQRNPKESR